jgi:hypothetical protein
MTDVLHGVAPNVKLDLEAEVPERTRLVFSYVVKNTGPQGVWVFNRLFRGYDQETGLELNPNIVNVRVEESFLVFYKGVSPLPEVRSVQRPWVPCLTALEPGQDFRETVQARLPLRVSNDYANVADRHLVHTQIQMPAVFELGYAILTAPDARSKPFEVKTSLGPALTVMPFPAYAQSWVRVGPLAYPLPFLRIQEDKVFRYT